MPDVDFFTNCWERDYRNVLAEGFMTEKVRQFVYPFRKICVTINNVNDPSHARQLAKLAVERQEINEAFFVTECLPEALRICGMNDASLGRVRHFTDFYLVMVTSTNADYIVNCAADIELDQYFDWITPALQTLETNDNYLIANPSWGSDKEGAEREALRQENQYFVSQTFSDACFLGKRSVLAAPIYGFKHPSGSRYPLSHVGDVFEQRVDAFMKHRGYFRLTDNRVYYNHFGELGASYPRPSLFQRIYKRTLQTLSNFKQSREN